METISSDIEKNMFVWNISQRNENQTTTKTTKDDKINHTDMKTNWMRDEGANH